jgi:N-acetyl-gamma-glutamyl-phosphate reductase
VGASGYGGGELMRWLGSHPKAEVSVATSKTYAGQRAGMAFAGMSGSALVFSEDDVDAVGDCDLVYLAAGDSASMCMAGPLLESGKKVVDLGACFRFSDAGAYSRWYGEPHKAPDTNMQAVYGLPELHRKKIRASSLVGNPGCFTTAAILALAPAVKHNLIEANSIVIDGISGVSGAGRSKFGLDYHFAEMNENAWAYKIAGAHRHTGEIEQELSLLAGSPLKVSFTPHVVPMTRGVLVTAYANVNPGVTKEKLADAYRSMYEDEPFVYFSEDLPSTKSVMASNYCHIGLGFDVRTGRVTVISAIDNLGKGMAGQAVQNLNLLFGLEETTGLKGVGLWP